MGYSNVKRRLEVSAMLIEMGNTLMKEGETDKDHSIAQSGTFLILIGSLLFSEKDTKLFSELCGMFSAKKVLEKMDSEQFRHTNREGESYEEFIKRIKKMRGLGEDENLS